MDGTSEVNHASGAQIAMMFVPSHYSDLITEATASTFGGWTTSAETHTYATATTVTIPAGGLLKYAVGDKYKANQSIPLSAYWPMEDKDDDIIPATTANIGTPTYTAGKFSNALTLNGTDQALAITDATVFKPTGAFTIGMWVKATASAGNKAIFGSYSDDTNSNGFRVYVAATTGLVTLEFGNNAAATASTITGTTDITGALHHIVVSFQGNHTKLFVDGVLQASGYTVTPTYAATNYVRIGCLNDTGANFGWFAGQIDDLFFINGHAVDQYWVAAKYAAATAQTAANITATYQGNIITVADTLLTMAPNSDYALYNGTITSPYYSHSNPVGFPQWFNYACTPVGWAATPTESSRFSINGRILTTVFYISGTSNSTGTTALLPIAPVRASQSFGYSADNSVDKQAQVSTATNKTTTFLITVGGAGAAFVSWTASGAKVINATTIDQI